MRSRAAFGLAAFGSLASLFMLGCGASPEELYERGQASFKHDQLDPAISDLETFAAKSCGPIGAHGHCRQAYLTLGHAYERHQAPAKAWAAYDQALTFGPHGADGPIETDRDRMRQALSAAQQKETGHAPVIIRYRDEVSEEYTPRSMSIALDFVPLVSKQQDAGELRGPDFRRLYAGSIPAGAHVLVVEMAHDCNPGVEVPCARSRVHKDWPFTVEARTPSTIDIRAYAESGEGDAPARPALDFVVR